ncbi:hypothetical protein GCM10010442_65150 [Kitasatospora kifunensis]
MRFPQGCPTFGVGDPHAELHRRGAALAVLSLAQMDWVVEAALAWRPMAGVLRVGTVADRARVAGRASVAFRTDSHGRIVGFE